jgi:hypothetical protein
MLPVLIRQIFGSNLPGHSGREGEPMDSQLATSVLVRGPGEGPATWAMGSLGPGGLMSLYDEVGIPARERRLPGPDGLPMEEEIMRWNETGPRYGLSVIGPPIPAES